MATPPTGEQYEIRHGAQRVTVVEVGGALREYVVDGRAVLDGYGEHEMVTGARGQILVPWPNRIEDGAYSWDGGSLQLPLDEPERRCAIHGLARWRNWQVAEHEPDRIVMRLVLHAQPGFPWVLDLQVEHALSDAGLGVRTSARNLSDVPVPYGNGAHPYLTVGAAHVDECDLQLPAGRYLPTDDRGIPTGSEGVEGTPYDFRSPRRIGDLRIDYAFTDLRRDPDGRARVRLARPGFPAVALWVDDTYPYVEIFTGDTLPERKRRTGLGVEPMTCPPNAFRTGTDVVRLEPGASHVSSWGIERG